MPNPFHDETGRFCSKGEMGEAVDRLATAVAVAGDDGSAGFSERYQGALDAYFQLRKDYDDANSSTVSMPEEWVSSVATSGLQGIPQSAQGIEAYYRSGLNDKLREPSDYYASKAIDLITNPETPEWIKGEIYRDASLEVKLATIKGLQNVHRAYLAPHIEVTSEELMPFTWGENGHRPEITKALLASDRIAFDAKYQLAKERGQLGHLADYSDREYTQRLFKRIPDLERDLRQEWKSPLRSRESREQAARVLARNTESALLRSELREYDNAHVVRGESMISAMAQNPNLSEAEGIQLLDYALRTDSQNFELIYSNLKEGALSKALPRHYGNLSREITSTKAYHSVGAVRLSASQHKVLNEYTPALEAGLETHPGFDQDPHTFAAKVLGDQKATDYWHHLAIIDAEPERYAELQKESKRLLKEVRPAYRKGGVEGEEAFSQRQRVQGRLRRAHDVRVASLVLDQVIASRN